MRDRQEMQSGQSRYTINDYNNLCDKGLFKILFTVISYIMFLVTGMGVLILVYIIQLLLQVI